MKKTEIVTEILIGLFATILIISLLYKANCEIPKWKLHYDRGYNRTMDQ